MIVYRLLCSNGHGFEGWFASGDAFDAQRSAGQVACPSCDDRAVGKLPSAPYVNTGRGVTANPPEAKRAPEPAAMPVANAMAAVKAFILAQTEDVGRKFPEVARRIHYGEEEQRGVRGRVTLLEARALAEEGIEATPLPLGLGFDESAH